MFKILLLIYNVIYNTNWFSSYVMNKYLLSQSVIILFWIHFLNFRIPKKSKAIFEYIFGIVSFYLVKAVEEHNFWILLRKNCKTG